jgi:hypothetical protein
MTVTVLVVDGSKLRVLNATFAGKPVTEDAIAAFITGAALRLGKSGA